MTVDKKHKVWYTIITETQGTEKQSPLRIKNQGGHYYDKQFCKRKLFLR